MDTGWPGVDRSAWAAPLALLVELVVRWCAPTVATGPHSFLRPFPDLYLSFLHLFTYLIGLAWEVRGKHGGVTCDPGDSAQVGRFGGRSLYWLHHLARPLSRPLLRRGLSLA